VRRARQELVRRKRMKLLGTDLPSKLRATAIESMAESAALESLWTIASLGSFDEALATKLLDSQHAPVRGWTVRLLGERRRMSGTMAHRLDEFAETEPSLEVRVELACAAQRFPADQAMPIINANINRDIDTGDPRLPLLWWWSVERHSVSGREEVLRRFVRPTLWKSRLGRDVLLPKLIRRYAAEGTADGIASVVRLLNAAPDEHRTALWVPIQQGLDERTAGALPIGNADFKQLVTAAWHAAPANLTLLRLAIMLPHAAAFEACKREAFEPGTQDARRVNLLDILGITNDPTLLDAALHLAKSHRSEEVRRAALRLASRFDNPAIAPRLVELHQSSTSTALQSQIRDILLSRKTTAQAWLVAVDRGQIPASVTPVDQIRRVALFGDAEMNALVAKHWGKLQSATPEEKLAEVRRLNNDLRAAPGNVQSGELLFKKHCASCHQLFGDGTKLGPDLTTANRQDRDFLLVSLVDPDSVIRKEYVSVVIQTKDGRVLTGLPISRADAEIKLVDAKNESITVATSDIAEMLDSPVSLMSADLYRQLTPQELRDLLAYLQRKE
jgi:putative heme-binding domain-containing protein